MTRERCSGFNVFPQNVFYPVGWSDWSWYFDPKFTNTTLALSKDSLAIHVWNKKSSGREVGKNTAYGIVAQKHCPNVYTMSEDYF